jgi:hypothetical protein
MLCALHSSDREEKARIDAIGARLDALSAQHASLGPLLRSFRPDAHAHGLEHALDHRCRVRIGKTGRASNRTGSEAGTAARAGIEHVLDALGKSCLEPGALHDARITQPR